MNFHFNCCIFMSVPYLFLFFIPLFPIWEQHYTISFFRQNQNESNNGSRRIRQMNKTVVLNLFYSRHPSFVIEQFGDTPSFNLPENRRLIYKLAALLELFKAVRGSSAKLNLSCMFLLPIIYYCMNIVFKVLNTLK